MTIIVNVSMTMALSRTFIVRVRVTVIVADTDSECDGEQNLMHKNIFAKNKCFVLKIVAR